MAGVKKTKTKIDNAVGDNHAHVYIARLDDADGTWCNWKNKNDLFWNKYQIKETDMRVMTANFITDTYLDLTTGVFCVLITSKDHLDFGGIILDIDKDSQKGVYKYQCQDFTRQLQGKIELWYGNVTLHRLLEHLITLGNLPLTGDAKKYRKGWKKELSGLRPAYQYEQKYWGSIINFNPMTQSMHGVIKGKSIIEVIRDVVLGTGAYIDVYTNRYGILQVEPYHKKDWLESRIEIPFEHIKDIKIKFDTTNIITNVNVESSDQLGVGKNYTAQDLVNLDLASMFGNNGASISTSDKKENTNSAKGNNNGNVKVNATNPYGTKIKKIYINSDNIYGKSTDKQFMRDFAAAMRKQGWKTKIIGLGPNTHTEKYMNGCRDGVWFCIYGGADAAVFRETVKKNSYTNKLKSLNSRTVIGMRTGGNIRKGGKYYKWLPRAHDDNYSPSGFKGISYPLDVLTKGKVPIMYANSVKDMVAKFLAGGDNPEAC